MVVPAWQRDGSISFLIRAQQSGKEISQWFTPKPLGVITVSPGAIDQPNMARMNHILSVFTEAEPEYYTVVAAPNPVDNTLHLSGIPVGTYQVTIISGTGIVALQGSVAVRDDTGLWMDVTSIGLGTFTIQVKDLSTSGQERQFLPIRIVKH